MSVLTHILCIDTSSRSCSVAIASGDKILSLTEDHSGDHVRVLNQLIRDCLSNAHLGISDIHAIAVNIGPGSYTALRAGLATAKGLCVALNIPLIEISGLQALASMAEDSNRTRIISYIPARLTEVYIAVYDENLTAILEPRVLDLASDTGILAPYMDMSCSIVSSNPEVIQANIDLTGHIISNPPITATNLTKIAYSRYSRSQFSEINQITPEYLKDPNITQSKK